MSPIVIATVVSIVAIVIALYAVIRAHEAGTAITPTLITNSLEDANATATELTEVALTAVQASEQLWRTGKIAKSERLDRAFAYVKKWYPQLDQATIITALESAVLVVNSIVASLPDAKPAMTGPPPNQIAGRTP